VAGLFPGIFVGVLITLGIVWFLKRRRAQSKKKYSGDFGPVSYNVSDPIYNPILSARTDFLRRGSNSSHSKSSHKSDRPVISNPIPTDQWMGGASREPREMTDNPYNRAVPASAPAYAAQHSRNDSLTQRSRDRSQSPYTPTKKPSKSGRRAELDRRPSQLSRSDSTETIDVLMPAPSFLLQPPPAIHAGHNSARMSSSTTFTQLMQSAGFGRDSQDGVRTVSASRKLQDRVRDV
jgi:hypothetical protein